MSAIDLILLLHVAATWMMVGIIWFVQVVHYPLFEKVGTATFTDYQMSHMQRTSQVVLVPMFIEAGTAGLMLLQPPANVPFWLVLLGVIFIGVIWLITLVLQVPRHDILTNGLDHKALSSLIRTNWLRTLLWSTRGLLVLWMLERLFHA